MHACVCLHRLVSQDSSREGPTGFYLLMAKWLFFWPNTIIITHGCRGCTFDAALAGGTEIKSEEMTVGIKVVIDKEADAVC